MPSPHPSPPILATPRRRRPGIVWSLVGVSIAVPALLIYSVVRCFSLGADGAALRGAVLESPRQAFQPQVELRLGWLPLGLLRQGLRLADPEPAARVALESIRRVEVGVYELGDAGASVDASEVLAAGDRALRPLNWERAVGVLHEGAIVGVYSRETANDPDALEFCVLVRRENHLVLAAVGCRSGPLLEFARQALQ